MHKGALNTINYQCVSDLEQQGLSFSVKGYSLRGSLAKPASDTKDVVLLLHPHPLYGGDMDNPVIRSLENEFHKFGFATFRFNFRGALNSHELFAGVQGAVEDTSRAYQTLQDSGFHPIGVVGYSFGGSTALRFAATTTLDFVITLSASFNLFTENGYSAGNLSLIKYPILMFHGNSDTMVSFTDMEKIAENIGSNVTSVQLSGEGHFYLRSLPRVLDEISKFIFTLLNRE